MIEFPEGIPETLTMRLPPCRDCKTRLAIVDGMLGWYAPGRKLPGAFDFVCNLS